jgi:hypothetical protein
MRHELLEETISMIRVARFEPNVVRNRHWKVSRVDRCGCRQVLVVAFSPSVRRVRVQSRAILRRLLAS